MKRSIPFVNIIPVAAGIAFTLLLLISYTHSFSAGTDFLLGSFTSVYYFGAIVNAACLFMSAGLGDAIVLSSGEYNLGGEGQIYAGGFTAAIILANTEQLPAPVSLLLALLAALFSGILLTGISVLLKQYKNASILLTTFLVSSAVIPFIDALIGGRFRGTYGNLLATPFIREQVRFPHILPPSPLSAAALTAPLLCLYGWHALYRTNAGKKLLITGTSEEFAQYCGYPERRIKYTALLLSGMLHGLAGFIAITGTYYTCHAGFYSGLGWDALSCALIAGADPVFLLPSGLILSWLFTSADRVALNFNTGFDTSALIQGVMLACIAVKYAGGSHRDRNAG